MAAPGTARNHPEPARRSVRLWIDVTDELRAGQHGQCIVTARALGFRQVCLSCVMKPPELLRDAAVVDEGVERRQEQR